MPHEPFAAGCADATDRAVTDAAVTAVLLLTVLTPLALTHRLGRGARSEHRAPGTPAAGRRPGFSDRRTRAVLGVALVAVALLGPEVLSLVR